MVVFYFWLPMWFRQVKAKLEKQGACQNKEAELGLHLERQKLRSNLRLGVLHHTPAKNPDLQTWLVKRITCQMLTGVLSHNTGGHNLQAGITLPIVIASSR